MMHVDHDTIALLALGEDVADSEDRTHIERCAECRTVLEHMRETVTLARELTADERELPPPPPRLWDAIVHELADSGDISAGGPAATTGEDLSTVVPISRGERPDTERGTKPDRGRGRGGPIVWLAAAAAVLALAVVAATTLLGTREPSPNLIADTTLEPLADVEPAAARLVEGTRGFKLEITTTALPEPDGYYELWLIDTEVTRLISLGPLVEDGEYILPAGLTVSEFPVVDISLEPFDGDPAHSGNSVLRGVLPFDTETET